MLSANKNAQLRNTCIFILEIILFGLFAVFLFIPQCDDLIFRLYPEFQYSSFKELIRIVFNYGNGRYIGNLLDIVFCRMPAVFYALETVLIAIFAVIVEKIADIKNLKIFVMAAIILQSHLMFVDTVSWMSAFINYYIPVIMLSATILILKNSKNGLTQSKKTFYGILIFILGFSEQFFIEHNTVINVGISFLIIAYILISNRKGKKKKSYFLPALLFMSNILGCLLMFSYKFFCDYSSTFSGRHDYRKTLFSSGSLFEALRIIMKHGVYAMFAVSTSVFMFTILFILINKSLKGPHSQNKTHKKIFYIGVVSYYILYLSTMLIVITYGGDDLPDNSRLFIPFAALYVVLFAVFLISTAAILYITIIKQMSKKQKFITIILLLLAVASYLPFLFVLNGGYRCFAFSYLLLFAALLNIIKFSEQAIGFNTDKIITASGAASIIAILIYSCFFIKEKKVYNYKMNYYRTSYYLPKDNPDIVGQGETDTWDTAAGYKHEFIELEEFEKTIEDMKK